MGLEHRVQGLILPAGLRMQCFELQCRVEFGLAGISYVIS